MSMPYDLSVPSTSMVKCASPFLDFGFNHVTYFCEWNASKYDTSRNLKCAYSFELTSFILVISMRNIGTFSNCWWECITKLVQPQWRAVLKSFFKKLKIELPYDPAIPLLGIYLEETKVEKDACIPLFIAALFTIARTFVYYYTTICILLVVYIIK